MDEIIQRVTEKTGLSEDKARAAVDAVVGFLKQKLPGSIGTQIDTLLAGGALAGGAGLGDKLAGMATAVGGMFGKKE